MCLLLCASAEKEVGDSCKVGAVVASAEKKDWDSCKMGPEPQVIASQKMLETKYKQAQATSAGIPLH